MVRCGYEVVGCDWVEDGSVVLWGGGCDKSLVVSSMGSVKKSELETQRPLKV